MSTWDEKAYEHAEGRSGEHFGALPEQLFEWSARWQREALLAADVIERAAREVYGEDPAWGYVHDYGYGEVGAGWSQLPDDLQEKFRALGRNALTAALGIEGGET